MTRMDENRENVNSTTSSSKVYEISLQTSSNVVSNKLLNDVWSTNIKSFCSNNICDAANNILQNAHASHVKIWKTTLSKVDPVLLLENSISECINCTKKEYFGLEVFLKNECKCDQRVGGSFGAPNDIVNKNKRLKSLFGNIHPENENKEDEPFLKHKNCRSQTQNKNLVSVMAQNTSLEVDWVKKEQEDKAHKSIVAKITFKTAKEQLMGSNPAARRVLGTSRKAQSKFVSPIIGTNVTKPENMEPDTSDDKLKHIDAKMVELIESEIIDRGTPVAWEDIAGLQLAKSVIQEAVVWPLLRPDIFTGLRRPPKGILLFGPPGTGKTLIGKCVAAQCQATFFSISASSLTSKWIGDGEKMVRALFAVARCRQPAVIFIDEIDSLLTQRSDTEHEATRRIKTEFLVQFDGAATAEEDRLLIVGATNRPQELDEAARRRLVKRLYIPLPDEEARCQIVRNLLQEERNSLSEADMREVARLTRGYSGADVRSLCSEAAMEPVRAVPLAQIASIHTSKVRPICLQDFTNALQRVKPSVSPDDLDQYVKWNNTYGQGF